MNNSHTALLVEQEQLKPTVVEPALPPAPLCPALYQINTRVWLTSLSRTLGRPATLDDIPDAELDRLAEQGFDWIWLLSIWQTGPAAQQVSRSNPEWRREFHETLPDLCDDDIPGSGFAITGYTVHKTLGGDAALARLRRRLKQRGLRVMLDFVPNHMGLGHPWVEEHPEHFVRGTRARSGALPAELHLGQAEAGRFAAGLRPRSLLLRLARYAPARLRQSGHAGSADRRAGEHRRPVRRRALRHGDAGSAGCVRAHLGPAPPLFWPTATKRVRERVPGFTFMAEVYWELEWTMQHQGFDYAYDKRLYDRLREGHARLREHLLAGLDYQNKLARFLENHDEPRAAAAFPPGVHEAAAVITFLSPGLRFFHQGQFEGRKKRISPHLGRGPDEPIDEKLKQFYERLLAVLRQPVVRNGQWQLLECTSAWEGNWTHDCFLAFAWHGPQGESLIVAVNYAPNQSQCHVRLPPAGLAGKKWQLQDQLSSASYEWNGDDLQARGLFLDMTPWQSAVFALVKRD